MALKYRLGFKHGFQTLNTDLAHRLLEILSYKEPAPNHLVCLPACSFSIGTSYLRERARNIWNQYTAHNIDYFLEMTSKDYIYGDSTISRFYLSHKDKSRCKEFVSHMQKIWEGREVIMIEGALTCLGYGNDLFANAKSIKRILCPNKNAFDKYDLIKRTVIEHTNNNQVLILALGMTATVLAYDLAKEGRQALDLGHIDIEYEWMLMGAQEKVAISGKFTNEANNGHIENIIYPQDFQKQILIDISK